MADESLLRAVDAKLTAVLALMADAHLRAHGTQRQQRSRSLDRILTDSGLTAREVGRLLGKTERAVHLVLQAENASRKKAAPTGAQASGD